MYYYPLFYSITFHHVNFIYLFIQPGDLYCASKRDLLYPTTSRHFYSIMIYVLLILLYSIPLFPMITGRFAVSTAATRMELSSQ